MDGTGRRVRVMVWMSLVADRRTGPWWEIIGLKYLSKKLDALLEGFGGIYAG